MKKYKVGDRVQVVHSVTWGKDGDAGKYGTIIAYDYAYLGHDDWYRLDTTGEWWWKSQEIHFSIEQKLELLSEV